MRLARTVVRLSTILAAFAYSAVPVGAQPAGAGSIEGRVVNPGTGSAARGAMVTAFYSPVFAPRGGQPLRANTPSMVDTDEQGHFSFRDLPAGRYQLRAQRRNAAGGPSDETVLYLGEGQQLKDVNLAMPSQAVVAGKVVDEFGDPVERAQVSLLRPSSNMSATQWMSAGASNTNDLGEYRITVGTPGSYLLCASIMGNVRSTPNGQPAPEGPELAYVTTFYPSATELSGATRFTVGSSGEVHDIDVHLKKVPTVRVRGRVVAPLLGANQRVAPTLQPIDEIGRAHV